MGFDAHKNKYQTGKYHSNKYLRFVVTCKGHLLEGQGYDAQNLAVDPFDLGRRMPEPNFDKRLR